MLATVKSLTKKAGVALTLLVLSASKVSAVFSTEADRLEGTAQEPFRNAVIRYINYFLSFLGLLAVCMVVYAGILMVSSQGDEEQAKKGKTIIYWAAIGIVIILLSYTIVNFVIGVETTGT